MSKEEISTSIVNFIIKNGANDSIINLYNKWSLTANPKIEDTELFNWTLDFLHDIRSVNESLLNEAYKG